MEKYIFSFEEAVNLGSEKLGGKGASLVQMTSLNMPVPPGFIITTDAGRKFSQSKSDIANVFGEELQEQISRLEKKAKEAKGQILKFGDSKYPLLVSVRSGAPISMPGQMSTLLNIGLTSKSLENLCFGKKLSHELYWRLYRTFALGLGIDRGLIQKLEGKTLESLGLNRSESLSAVQLDSLIIQIKDLLADSFGKGFVKNLEDPESQLLSAIKTVWDSWDTASNQAYRRSLGIGNDTWTAVVVQMMVLGNKNEKSGTGVVYSRDLRTGERRDPLAGSFLFNAQGEEIVSGEAKGDEDLGVLKSRNESLYHILYKYVDKLEEKYKNPMDIEFTIEDGKLWLLQARTAPLSDRALIQFVVDLTSSNGRGISQSAVAPVKTQATWKLDERDAVERVRPSLMERLYLPVFSKDAKEKALQDGKLLAKGIPASPGTAVGKIVVTVETANKFARSKQPFIWVRDALDPKEHQIMRSSTGVISIRSSVGSHGAIMANVLKKPCVVCCNGLEEVNEIERYIMVKGKKIYEENGTEISVDAISGEIFLGNLPTIKAEAFPALTRFEKWWDKYDGTKENKGLVIPDDGRPHSPWGNATRPEDYKLVDGFREEVRQYLTHKGWNTEKAQVVEAMNIISDEMRIKQVVVDATDKALLAKAMRDVFKKRKAEGTPVYWNGPRSALGPGAEGASPWQMGMNKDEQIDAFLNQRDFKGVEKAKSGGYPRWMNPDPTDPWKSPPVQIIVMYDPAEKGVEEFEAQHFVCNVSCRSNPDEVMVDVNLGTAQLRSFEKISPESLIRLTMELNPAIPDFRGRRILRFGKKYWKLSAVNNLSEFARYDNKQIENIIEDGMESGDLSDEIFTRLVGTRTLKVTRYIESQVFGDWWTKYDLPYRMRALDEVFSLQVLEIQGRADTNGNVIWFLVYDAKGRDEKKTIADSI